MGQYISPERRLQLERHKKYVEYSIASYDMYAKFLLDSHDAFNNSYKGEKKAVSEALLQTGAILPNQQRYLADNAIYETNPTRLNLRQPTYYRPNPNKNYMFYPPPFADRIGKVYSKNQCAQYEKPNQQPNPLDSIDIYVFEGKTGMTKNQPDGYRSPMGYVAYDRQTKEITVTFRGSRSSNAFESIPEALLFKLGNVDWVTDLQSIGYPPQEFKELAPNGVFQYGFAQAYLSCQNDLVNVIKKIRQSDPTARPKLVFTGHSLGGGLANIGFIDAKSGTLTEKLKEMMPTEEEFIDDLMVNSECFTVSAPPVCDAKVNDNISEKQREKFHKISCDNDMVTTEKGTLFSCMPCQDSVNLGKAPNGAMAHEPYMVHRKIQEQLGIPKNRQEVYTRELGVEELNILSKQGVQKVLYLDGKVDIINVNMDENTVAIQRQGDSLILIFGENYQQKELIIDKSRAVSIDKALKELQKTPNVAVDNKDIMREIFSYPSERATFLALTFNSLNFVQMLYRMAMVEYGENNVPGKLKSVTDKILQMQNIFKINPLLSSLNKEEFMKQLKALINEIVKDRQSSTLKYMAFHLTNLLTNYENTDFKTLKEMHEQINNAPMSYNSEYAEKAETALLSARQIIEGIREVIYKTKNDENAFYEQIELFVNQLEKHANYLTAQWVLGNKPRQITAEVIEKIELFAKKDELLNDSLLANNFNAKKKIKDTIQRIESVETILRKDFNKLEKFQAWQVKEKLPQTLIVEKIKDANDKEIIHMKDPINKMLNMMLLENESDPRKYCILQYLKAETLAQFAIKIQPKNEVNEKILELLERPLNSLSDSKKKILSDFVLKYFNDAKNKAEKDKYLNGIEPSDPLVGACLAVMALHQNSVGDGLIKNKLIEDTRTIVNLKNSLIKMGQ